MATMIFAACVVALIILYLVTSLIIEENKGTISLFKIFGYKRKEIKSLVLNSSTYVVLVGFIISIPIMLASMGALYDYIGSMVKVAMAEEGGNFNFPSLASKVAVCQTQEMIIT